MHVPLPIERLTCLHAQHVRMHRMCAHERRARASKHAPSWRDYTHKLLYSENKALNLNKNNLVEFFRPNQCYPALLHHHAWTLTHLCGQGKDRAWQSWQCVVMVSKVLTKAFSLWFSQWPYCHDLQLNSCEFGILCFIGLSWEWYSNFGHQSVAVANLAGSSSSMLPKLLNEALNLLGYMDRGGLLIAVSAKR